MTILQGIVQFFVTLWKIINSPDNDPIILGLLIALSGTLFSTVRSYFSHRKLCMRMQSEIDRLAAERNELQEILFTQFGISRKSSKPSKTSKTSKPSKQK